MDFLFIIIGLVLLVFGGDWLLKAAVGMSLRLNISKIVIGMTVVSFATSAPELIVSVKSAMAGFPDIALGNVVGSNIANIGLILGIVMIISEMKIDESFFKTDWPAMIIASLLLFGILLYDGEISRLEGIILFILLILFIIYLLKAQKNKPVEIDLPEANQMKMYLIFIFLILGGAALYGGSELLIKGAVNVAKTFGVSDRVIAVTVVAIGTSIPELAASLIAAIKKESSISIGNVLGSNIFNILSVLGLTAIIHPIKLVDNRLITFDIYWMLGFSLILLPLVLLPKKGYLDRKAGIILLGSYILFVYLTFA
ncbi:calcium/sodium antiporter [Flavobacterium azooxidireducens]|uniref:Calcium/sodium antiporter n=1 Tax=Flavobacterium azooxidireducens TaxID=1871076 RepID=A0ABY4KGA7_9FLAO|nr:calcium/sodium antiporter [Flavobacterium azooxidireducens]UPQ79589.1 calcium/sodium antiporter [Flavobacterium azooxidireducens]